jgi:hypothetical protein
MLASGAAVAAPAKYPYIVNEIRLLHGLPKDKRNKPLFTQKRKDSQGSKNMPLRLFCFFSSLRELATTKKQ